MSHINRRTITLFLLFVLPFAFIGCGRPAPDTPRLVLLTPGGPIRKGVEKAVAEFRRENPSIEVQIVTTPGKDYYVKSLTMLAGRAHVDLLWMGQGFGMFASREALLDLTPLAANEPGLLDRFHPEVLSWYRFGERLYGIPYGIDCYLIAYNKALFEKAGVPFPSPDWTLDDMLDTMRQLQQVDPENGRILVAGAGLSDLDYRFYNLSLLDEHHERFALNTPEGLEWLKRCVRLVNERLLHRGSEMETMDRLTRFFNSRAAMMNIATWDVAEIRRQALFDWDVVRLPKGTSGENLTWASSAGFSISRRSEHPELAWQLLKKLVGPEFQRSMFETILPADQSLNDAYLAAHPKPPEHLREIQMQLDGLRPNPRITAFQEVESEWLYWYEQVMMGKIAPEVALPSAETKINRILELHRQEAAQP